MRHFQSNARVCWIKHVLSVLGQDLVATVSIYNKKGTKLIKQCEGLATSEEYAVKFVVQSVNAFLRMNWEMSIILHHHVGQQHIS